MSRLVDVKSSGIMTGIHTAHTRLPAAHCYLILAFNWEDGFEPNAIPLAPGHVLAALTQISPKIAQVWSLESSPTNWARNKWG